DELPRHIEQMRNGRFDPVHHRDRTAALLEDGQVYGRLAIHTHDARLNLGGIGGATYIGDEDRGAVHRLQRQLIDLLDVVELAVGIDVVIEAADANIAGRQDQVRAVDRANDVHDAHVVGLQLHGVHVDHDLPVAAAEGLRHRCTGHTRDLIANVVLPEIAQPRLPEPLALQGDQAHRQTCGVELQHDGRQCSFREL